MAAASPRVRQVTAETPPLPATEPSPAPQPAGPAELKSTTALPPQTSPEAIAPSEPLPDAISDHYRRVIAEAGDPGIAETLLAESVQLSDQLTAAVLIPADDPQDPPAVDAERFQELLGSMQELTAAQQELLSQSDDPAFASAEFRSNVDRRAAAVKEWPVGGSWPMAGQSQRLLAALTDQPLPQPAAEQPEENQPPTEPRTPADAGTAAAPVSPAPAGAGGDGINPPQLPTPAAPEFRRRQLRERIQTWLTDASETHPVWRANNGLGLLPEIRAEMLSSGIEPTANTADRDIEAPLIKEWAPELRDVLNALPNALREVAPEDYVNNELDATTRTAAALSATFEMQNRLELLTKALSPPSNGTDQGVDGQTLQELDEKFHRRWHELLHDEAFDRLTTPMHNLLLQATSDGDIAAGIEAAQAVRPVRLPDGTFVNPLSAPAGVVPDADRLRHVAAHTIYHPVPIEIDTQAFGPAVVAVAVDTYVETGEPLEPDDLRRFRRAAFHQSLEDMETRAGEAQQAMSAAVEELRNSGADGLAEYERLGRHDPTLEPSEAGLSYIRAERSYQPLNFLRSQFENATTALAAGQPDAPVWEQLRNYDTFLSDLRFDEHPASSVVSLSPQMFKTTEPRVVDPLKLADELLTTTELHGDGPGTAASKAHWLGTAALLATTTSTEPVVDAERAALLVSVADRFNEQLTTIAPEDVVPEQAVRLRQLSDLLATQRQRLSVEPIAASDSRTLNLIETRKYIHEWKSSISANPTADELNTGLALLKALHHPTITSDGEIDYRQIENWSDELRGVLDHLHKNVLPQIAYGCELPSAELSRVNGALATVETLRDRLAVCAWEQALPTRRFAQFIAPIENVVRDLRGEDPTPWEAAQAVQLGIPEQRPDVYRLNLEDYRDHLKQVVARTDYAPAVADISPEFGQPMVLVPTNRGEAANQATLEFIELRRSEIRTALQIRSRQLQQTAAGREEWHRLEVSDEPSSAAGLAYALAEQSVNRMQAVGGQLRRGLDPYSAVEAHYFDPLPRARHDLDGADPLDVAAACHQKLTELRAVSEQGSHSSAPALLRTALTYAAAAGPHVTARHSEVTTELLRTYDQLAPTLSATLNEQQQQELGTLSAVLVRRAHQTELTNQLGIPPVTDYLLEKALKREPVAPEPRFDHRQFPWLKHEVDSAFAFAIASRLQEEFPDLPPNSLNAAFGHLTSTQSLSEFAGDVGLGEHMPRDTSPENQSISERDEVTARTLEAVANAVHIDQGAAGCQQLVDTLIDPVVAGVPKGSIVQELKNREREIRINRTMNEGLHYRTRLERVAAQLALDEPAVVVQPSRPAIATVTVGDETFTAKATHPEEAKTAALQKAVEAVTARRNQRRRS